MTDAKFYMLTIEDYDPTWSEWSLDRLPDVHGAPASERHFWSVNGHRIEGYTDGAVCGLCGWRPGPDRGDTHV